MLHSDLIPPDENGKGILPTMNSRQSSGLDVAGPSQPQMYPSEDGGYIVDPSTVSSSPIRTFTRISEMPSSEKAGYLRQFDHSRRKKGRRSTLKEGGNQSGWHGRSDFDELASGQHIN